MTRHWGKGRSKAAAKRRKRREAGKPPKFYLTPRLFAQAFEEAMREAIARHDPFNRPCLFYPGPR